MCGMKVFIFFFYFTCEQRKRSTEGSDEEKETPGKHEKKKSKKDKKKAKEKEKDSSDEVSKQHVGHLQDSFYRSGLINIKSFQRQSNWFSQADKSLCYSDTFSDWRKTCHLSQVKTH